MYRARGLILGLVLVAAVAGVSRVGRAISAEPPRDAAGLFARDNLIAWCIVPFDSKKRGPAERAAMLKELGFRHFAYDWRAEHIPTFDAEVLELQKQGISLDAFWVAPGELNRESRIILDVLGRHKIKAQLWVLLDFGADRTTGPGAIARVEQARAKLAPLAREAGKIGCSLALYNHGGWFGEPENQIAIIEALRKQGVANVGMVYNLHHGHEHLDRLPALLAMMKPYLVAINLNGMDPGGDRVGRKILPLGQGPLDLEILRMIVRSGYRGPIGILGHTQDDARLRLMDNLDGLDWLVPQLEGKRPGPAPRPRTPVAPRPPAKPAAAAPANPDDPKVASALLADAIAHGDAPRGAALFASTRFACVSCHRVGEIGGSVGPDLTTVGLCKKPEEIVESILSPRRTIAEGFAAVSVATIDGRVRQGYRVPATEGVVVIRDPATGVVERIAADQVDAIRQDGSLMPDGLAQGMTSQERRDLVRFVLDLGRPGARGTDLVAASMMTPAAMPLDRAPLEPEFWPSWRSPVNRDRIYDFYAKEAEYFMARPVAHGLLPAFPGLDGGTLGHWGNQDDTTWADARWQGTDLGSLMRGVFRGAGVVVPKGVCVRLGDHGELACCFNPETLCYEAVWKGGFVTFSPNRHGLLDGLIMAGTPLERPAGARPKEPFRYQGCYRDGDRVVFAYRIGATDYLDAPWVENGRLTRVVAPRETHPLAAVVKGGLPRWPRPVETKGRLGTEHGGWPYVVDVIEPPFVNPWHALLFFSDLDFLPDGSALVCTLQGDVWRVTGLDGSLKRVSWRRFASGLHQATGLVVHEGAIYVLGRDEITRLHDLNHDGEADFYECFSNAQETSPAGHDFVSGLARDAQGRFHTASSKQGLVRFAADGRSAEVIATGLRNPDGLGIDLEGRITVPLSEGDWTPASMVVQVRPGDHYGYPGPKGKEPPALPLVYLPRGLDNSSASQVAVPDDRFGPFKGKLIHLSFGLGTHFLLLSDQVAGQPQGAFVLLPGEFPSGPHRGRFRPQDGQLYVVGSAGWGTYTTDDGCLARVRYTGGPVQAPIAVRPHANGLMVTFSQPLESERARPDAMLVQVWNYRYSGGYGSPEFSTHHPGVVGHDRLAITGVYPMNGGKTLFLEIPELQPVSQLHLHVRGKPGRPIDLFATIHRLDSPFTGFPGYRPTEKAIAAHPILADMVALDRKPAPNPHHRGLPGARAVMIKAGPNLSYQTRMIKARPGEAIKLTFVNPDVVPHNWALLKPGTAEAVGTLADKLIAQPDAALRHYIPDSSDILAHTDLVGPQEQSIISFHAPDRPGRYPYLCTFPGHWRVMNGELVVE